MLKIRFRYKDSNTNGEWRYREAIMPSVQACIKCYKLDEREAYDILEFYPYEF